MSDMAPQMPRPQRRSSIIQDPIAPDVAQIVANAEVTSRKSLETDNIAIPSRVLEEVVRSGTPPIDMSQGEHGALQHAIDKLGTIDMEKELRMSKKEQGKAAAADFAKSQAAWKFELDLGLDQDDVDPWSSWNKSPFMQAAFKVGDFLSNLATSVSSHLPGHNEPAIENLVRVGPQPRHSIVIPSSVDPTQAGNPMWVRRNVMGSFENTSEIKDSPEELQEKIKELVDHIKKAEYVVVFTGAGVSTGCGIPDYRGPKGVWTSRAAGLPEPAMPKPEDVKPGMAHRCIAKLFETGHIKFVITQNVDGLHLRSGLPSTHLAELHGNFNIERCTQCENICYVRNKDKKRYPTRSSEDHDVGRRCKNCKAPMRDIMVQFGEPMPRVPLQAAQRHTQLADIFLVLGSSLSVYPAHTLPRHVTERGKLLSIVNYQHTAFDDSAGMRIFADTAQVLQELCKGLGVDPGEFVDVEDDLARDNAGLGWEEVSE